MKRLAASSLLLSGLLFGVGLLWGNAHAQEAEAFVPRWYIGPTYKTDGFSLGAGARGAGLDQRIGLQVFHRMEPIFGTGGSLWFDPGGNSFEVTLDARWIWPLPVVEPYAAAQIGYLTRDVGGLSLEFRPGILAEIPGLPFQIDVFVVSRYDAVEALFGSQNPNQLLFGLGSTLQFRL